MGPSPHELGDRQQGSWHQERSVGTGCWTSGRQQRVFTLHGDAIPALPTAAALNAKNRSVDCLNLSYNEKQGTPAERPPRRSCCRSIRRHNACWSPVRKLHWPCKNITLSLISDNDIDLGERPCQVRMSCHSFRLHYSSPALLRNSEAWYRQSDSHQRLAYS